MSTQSPSVARIETVIVDPDDIVAALQDKHCEVTDSHSHRLQITPPFTTEETVTLQIADETQDVAVEDHDALQVPPETFVADGGELCPQTTITLPTRADARSAAQADYGDDVDEEIIQTYHTAALDVWEDHLRQNLAETVTLSQPDHSTTTATAEVQYINY